MTPFFEPRTISIASLLVASTSVGCANVWHSFNPRTNPTSPASAVASPPPLATAVPVTTLPPAMVEPPPAKEELPRVAFPESTQHQLANGVRITASHQHGAPLTTVTLTTRHAHFKSFAENQLAPHAMVAGGAGRYTASQLAKKLADAGTSLEVDTGIDAATWTLTFPPEHLDTAVEILAAVARSPRWVYADFNRIRHELMTQAREQTRHDALGAATRVVHQELFPNDHPYAYPIVTAKQLGNINLASCQRWHRQNVRPPTTTLVVVGAHESSEVLTLAEKHLGPWKTVGQPPPNPQPFPAVSAPNELTVRLVDQKQTERTQVVMAWLAPGANHADHAAVHEGLSLICGTVGQFVPHGAERISRCKVMPYAGETAVASVVVRSRAGDVSDTVKRLTDAVSEVENATWSEARLEANARDLLGRAPRRWESSEGLAHALARMAILEVPSGWSEGMAQTWRNVSEPRTRAAFREYLSLRHAVMVVVADSKQVKASLSKVTPLEVADEDVADE